ELITLVEIRGDQAIVTSKRGSDSIPLSRLTPATAADTWAQTIRNGVLPEAKVTVGGNVGALGSEPGELVTVVELRGDQAIVTSKRGSDSIPLSRLTPATAAKHIEGPSAPAEGKEAMELAWAN